MAKAEPTTVTPEVVAPARTISGEVSNPTLIDWPHDPHGFTTVLRKEGVRAIGRVNGNAEKAEIVIATLQCLAQHLKVRVPDQVAAIEKRLDAAANREAAEVHLSVADAKRRVARVKAELTYAEEAVEALTGGAK